jgi:hypothetical protein
VSSPSYFISLNAFSAGGCYYFKDNYLYYFFDLFNFRSNFSPDNRTAISIDGLWKSYISHIVELCTICEFTSQPVIYFKGFCEAATLNWVFYPQNNGYQIMYSGYKESLIVFANNTWTIKNRFGDTVPTITLKDSKLEYPVGRKEWIFGNMHLEGCPDVDRSVNLTFSPCIVGREFSCGDGLCVALEKRCNNRRTFSD